MQPTTVAAGRIGPGCECEAVQNYPQIEHQIVNKILVEIQSMKMTVQMIAVTQQTVNLVLKNVKI